MSQNPSTTASSSSFNEIFEKSLKAYKIKTKQDLISHPLAVQLQACKSPAAILTVLQDQVNQFEQARSGEERLRRWLNPTINVLFTFSATLGAGVSLARIDGSVDDIALTLIRQVYPPAQAIFAGAGVLLQVSALAHLPAQFLVTFEIFRRLRTLKRAKVSLSIFSSASKISFEDLNLTLMSHPLLP